MELTASHAMQIAILVCTIAGGYAVVKQQLARVMQDLSQFVSKSNKDKNSFDDRLDAAEARGAVFESRINILSEINSVAALEVRSREMATLQAKVSMLVDQVTLLNKLHNGNHPVTGG